MTSHIDLYYSLGEKERAISLSQPFMQQVIANFDNDWTLSGAEIDSALRKIAA